MCNLNSDDLILTKFTPFQSLAHFEDELNSKKSSKDENCLNLLKN
jgi:hypothetical protein